jgi:hypothetical protein
MFPSIVHGFSALQNGAIQGVVCVLVLGAGNIGALISDCWWMPAIIRFNWPM